MVGYYEDYLTVADVDRLFPGDKLVFIDPRSPADRDEKGKYLHEKVCTVKHISMGGFGGAGIEVEELPGTHYIPRCFHFISDTDQEVEHDFDEVFG